MTNRVEQILPVVEDCRGRLIEVSRGEIWRQVSYTETGAQQVRGNHYHKSTTEMFYILAGAVEVDLLNVNTREEVHLKAVAGQAFRVFPYELHTVRTLSACRWITLLTEPFDPGVPDIYRID